MSSSSFSSTSGIRDLVRSVVNEGDSNAPIGGGGAFGDESMRTFFAEIKGLVNAAFHALYEEVQQVENKDSRWKRGAMERGLAFMNDRRNENAIIDSVVESEDACRSLTRQYFSAMHAFVRETVSKKRDILHVNFVPFGTFIARLYRKLSSVPEMKDKYFTTMSYTEKDMLLRDVLRQVMQTSVVWPSGQTASGSIAPPPSFSTPIRPSDSVSNISHNHPPPKSIVGSVVGQSVANTIMSAVKDVSDAVKDDSGLTPDKLSHHNRSNNSSSRFSHFTNPSVVKGGDRPSVVKGGDRPSVVKGGDRPSVVRSRVEADHKVIKIGQSDPHALPRGPRGPNDDSSKINDSSSRITSRTENEYQDE
jgi:hypothetical protein